MNLVDVSVARKGGQNIKGDGKEKVKGQRCIIIATLS